MLTDEEIARLTRQERQQLIARLSQPVDDFVPSSQWLQRTRELRIGLMVLSAVVLVPWTVYLGMTLPPSYVAHNWDRTWVGFDVLLTALMVATAVLGYLGRQLLVPMAFATGLLLVCDAWFDVMTSSADDRAWSLVTALVVELPLAALLITGSLQVMRLVAARLWALEPGMHSWEVRIPLPSEADLAVRPRRPDRRRGQVARDR